jgi:SAM-dependent methyltransferase
MSSYVKNDKAGFEEFYGNHDAASVPHFKSSTDFAEHFERTSLSPFYNGGSYKGYGKWLAVQEIVKSAEAKNRARSEITVLDAGSGMGKLSIYLASIGFNVIGVEISEEGCAAATKIAVEVGVSDTVTFLAQSLESVTVETDSIDFVIGSAALHHFIKYDGVPAEFKRIMKPGAMGFFVDAYSENPLYRLFHNREKMERLGDVLLNKPLIEDYFSEFEVRLLPTDWFVMLDKFYTKLLPKKLEPMIRRISRVHYNLDRKMPTNNRVALWLSGAVLTSIKLPN